MPSHVLGKDGAVSPSERITLGVIGIGSRCTYDLKAMIGLPDVQCVAIADVQSSRREAGKRLVDEHYGNQACRLYRDFRELLDRKDIDAVLIATGDRWHASASMMAAHAGKDVYCEKPCGLTIAYCQELSDTMERTGRVFQAGTQRRSVPNFQQAVELAHTGKFGKIHTLYASVYKPAINNSWLPGEPTPLRDTVDWNLWLGPATWRPYNSQYVAGKWRGYYDFDSGAKLLDWGSTYRRPLPMGESSRRHRADRVRTVGQEHYGSLRKWSEVGTGLPGNSVWRAPGMDSALGHVSSSIRGRRRLGRGR
jgi:predicted dehydrogenase